MTYRDKVAAYFKAHPVEWIDGMVLSQLGGVYAWRTRVSECRTQLQMPIDNRICRTEGGMKVSQYRYVPRWE